MRFDMFRCVFRCAPLCLLNASMCLSMCFIVPRCASMCLPMCFAARGHASGSTRRHCTDHAALSACISIFIPRLTRLHTTIGLLNHAHTPTSLFNHAHAPTSLLDHAHTTPRPAQPSLHDSQSSSDGRWGAQARSRSRAFPSLAKITCGR